MQALELPSCLFMPQHVCLKIYSPIYTLVGTRLSEGRSHLW